MADRITQFRDALGAADSYLHAMRQMFETVFNGEGKDYCALHLLAEAAQKEVGDAQALVDELERDR